jgi:glycosyltransferase involved in cell wall biosynthesis
MPKISVCVPVYTMKDNMSERFLVEFFSNLVEQTFKDFEVVVSDQSDFDHLRSITDTFSHVLDINYVRNTSGKKNAANNVNYAIKHAKGEIVKLLYMDDFFVDPNALGKIAKAFDENTGKWLIGGFLNCNEDRTQFYNARAPWYGNTYVNGDNSTGNPSNYSVRRECALEMDENLAWIVDGEYFYRSYYHYGDPIMINEFLVCFRDHGDSAFKKDSFRELDAKERQYCVDKFSGVVEHKLI